MVLNRNLDSHSEAGLFILDMLDVMLSRKRLEFKKQQQKKPFTLQILEESEAVLCFSS